MIKEYWDKYKDVILYLVFGVFTTVVNIVSYWVCAHVFGMSVMASTVIAWALAVFFAYVTNRTMVFHSSATEKGEILKEIGSFFACRLGTGVVDWVIMFVFVNVLHFNDMIVKIAANFIVIVLNYILSKFVIFKH
ncbi:MAG: GtrA family protein [Lachnospiraceae bacterium]|jgi:putative flippase GtrA|nr:GtrA family protein [Lachnospiraceae bacterium]